LLLADALLAGIALQDSELEGKKLSTEAKNIVLKHTWPGNVRELQATLLRAALWSQSDTIGPEDVADALFEMPPAASSGATLDFSQGIDINGKIRDFARAHLIEALKYTGGNKTRAAELLGLASQQTLTNWMKKYDVE